MNAPLWREPGDPALYRAIKGLFDLARRTRSRPPAAGVRKFASIEEMDRARSASPSTSRFTEGS
jgi:hypothetical protein